MQANPATQNIGVVNQAAGGNAVLSGGLGPPLMQRYTRDGITQQGVKYIMIFEGVNDIGGTSSDISGSLINAFKQIASDAHKAGILVFGATITPLGTSYYSASRESTRQKVNKWIMDSGGVYDGAVDFDKILRDSGNPSQLASKYNSGDGLHPNVAGYQALADAFPLDIFSKTAPKV
jgi:lysophospholipase L1-like esterase